MKCNQGNQNALVSSTRRTSSPRTGHNAQPVCLDSSPSSPASRLSALSKSMPTWVYCGICPHTLHFSTGLDSSPSLPASRLSALPKSMPAWILARINRIKPILNRYPRTQTDAADAKQTTNDSKRHHMTCYGCGPTFPSLSRRSSGTRLALARASGRLDGTLLIHTRVMWEHPFRACVDPSHLHYMYTCNMYIGLA